MAHILEKAMTGIDASVIRRDAESLRGTLRGLAPHVVRLLLRTVVAGGRPSILLKLEPPEHLSRLFEVSVSDDRGHIVHVSKDYGQPELVREALWDLQKAAADSFDTQYCPAVFCRRAVRYARAEMRFRGDAGLKFIRHYDVVRLESGRPATVTRYRPLVRAAHLAAPLLSDGESVPIAAAPQVHRTMTAHEQLAMTALRRPLPARLSDAVDRILENEARDGAADVLLLKRFDGLALVVSAQAEDRNERHCLAAAEIA